MVMTARELDEIGSAFLEAKGARSAPQAMNEILNYHHPNDHRILNDGLVLAIEPFLTTGMGRVTGMRDGWSLRTSDNAIAAQFEHTIVVTKNETIVLTQ
jgi:methionyl aminopeptidase